MCKDRLWMVWQRHYPLFGCHHYASQYSWESQTKCSVEGLIRYNVGLLQHDEYISWRNVGGYLEYWIHYSFDESKVFCGVEMLISSQQSIWLILLCLRKLNMVFRSENNHTRKQNTLQRVGFKTYIIYHGHYRRLVRVVYNHCIGIKDGSLTTIVPKRSSSES